MDRGELMKINIERGILLLAILFLIYACAGVSPQQIGKSWERPEACREFLDRLDTRVMEAGVRDAASYPVPGFPYLRANRFLSALKGLARDEVGKKQRVRWMQTLDLEGRKKEIYNLPEAGVQGLGEGEKPDREKLYSRVESCSAQLLEHDEKRQDFYSTLDPLVKIPDEYSTFRQVVGLYPIASIPVAVASENSQKKFQNQYDIKPGNLRIDGSLQSFVPKEGIYPDGKELALLMEESRRNPLQVPLPDPQQENRLVRAFAPIFIQDVAAPYDRPGEVVWKGKGVEIDAKKPAVYYYLSYAFLKGEPILQINYAVWYSARAGENAPWFERGHLDGLTLRVSLDSQGNPFMVEAINNCGCYHLFAPEKAKVGRVISWPYEPAPFVPQWLPVSTPEERLGIRLNSGWHQVQRLLAVKEPPNPIPYELVPYDILESLPRENGQRESIFDARGIAKGSERQERFILFSMGIPKVGSMRQRGHHAIEFLSRVHFDEPGLFDHYFDFK
jgi:hypothetical protein